MNSSLAISTWSGASRVWLRKRGTSTEKHAQFDALVARDWERFWRFAYRLTGDPDLAEDVLSETLIDAFAAFDRFRGERFDSWFFKMLSNNSIDLIRKARRRPAQSLDTAFSESEGRDIADSAATPEQRALEPLFSEPVQDALDRLPEEFRVAVLLADVEGYDYAEVAQILGIPIGTVRSRISRGRDRLRALLS